jgi:hypothetical protein
MLEIIGLVIAATAIAGLARGRGASPLFMGSIAVGGYLLILFGGTFFVPRGEGRALLLIPAWAWIAVVAGYVRFVVGARMPKPDGKWNCSNCRYLNNASSVICEACQQPWRAA